MLERKRYLYVGFMCHQVIEKIFKGYCYSISNMTPPYTHNLVKLAKEGGFYGDFNDEQKDFIDILEPLNVEARYPSYKEALLRDLNEERCEWIVKQTEEMYKWIRARF